MKTMLKLFLPCVLAQILWVSPLRAHTPAITGYDIILIAGQSNAVGYGRYETAAVQTDPNVLEFACPPSNRHGCSVDDRTLQVASDPLSHLDSQTVRGFGMSFAQAYREQNPNRKVILVPAAVGSSTLLPYGAASVPKPAGWRHVVPGSGDTNLYTQAVQMTLKAFAAADTAAKRDAGGGDVRVAAILWAQGEADIQNVPCDGVGATVCAQPNMGAYKEELKKVVQGFRSDLLSVGGADIPFLAVGQSPTWVSWLKAPTEPRWEWHLKWKVLHRAHVDLAEELPAFRRLDTQGRSGQLPSNGEVCAGLSTCTDSKFDRIHYSADAQQRVGRELAEQMALLAKLTMRLVPRTGVDGTEWVNGVDGQIATRHGQIELATNGALDFKNRLGELKVVLPANTFVGSYTKMAWIKPRVDGSDTADSHIMSSTEPGQSHYFYYNQARKELAASQAKNGSRVAQVVASGIPANEWTHVATVYNESTQRTKLFVNGHLVAESQSPVLPLGAPNSHASTVVVVVGGMGNPTQRMNGRIHQPQMYRRAWSDWQIKQEFGRIAKPAD